MSSAESATVPNRKKKKEIEALLRNEKNYTLKPVSQKRHRDFQHFQHVLIDDGDSGFLQCRQCKSLFADHKTTSNISKHLKTCKSRDDGESNEFMDQHFGNSTKQKSTVTKLFVQLASDLNLSFRSVTSATMSTFLRQIF